MKMSCRNKLPVTYNDRTRKTTSFVNLLRKLVHVPVSFDSFIFLITTFNTVNC